ncbi:MAG: prepilin-type N-terminal cleavage/methylation domain-containing protein [Bacillota bacterium]
MNNEGFTLLEILISLIIIAVLILAITKVVYTVKKVNVMADNVFQASVYSQNLLEYLKSNNIKLKEGDYNFEELLGTNIKEFLNNDIKNDYFDNSLVSINKVYENIELQSEIFEIRILMIWKGVSDEKNYKISTYIYQK